VVPDILKDYGASISKVTQNIRSNSLIDMVSHPRRLSPSIYGPYGIRLQKYYKTLQTECKVITVM
jgi:hypothetical protein